MDRTESDASSSQARSASTPTDVDARGTTSGVLGDGATIIHQTIIGVDARGTTSGVLGDDATIIQQTIIGVNAHGTTSGVLGDNATTKQQTMIGVDARGTTSGVLGDNATIKQQIIIDKSNEEIESWTRGMVRVSAVDTVKKKLKSGKKWITITGNAGDGKTTLGYLVLKELQEEMNVYCIDTPTEYRQISKIKEDRILLFDDRFGAFTSDVSLINKWLDVIRKIINSQEKSSSQDNQTRVIFVSRKNVVEGTKDHLEHFWDIIFHPDCIVDLSVVKVETERMKTLEYHLQKRKVIVDAAKKARVVENITSVHGFPHCCKVYADLRSEGQEIDIEEFFKAPLKFLDNTTKFLYNRDCKELFRSMIKSNGRFNAYSIENENERYDLLKVVREQEGSYIIELKDGICGFTHPSVYESVLSVISETDSSFCVQYADLSVIRQKVYITTSGVTKPCFINVKPVPAVLKILAERFRPKVLEGDYSVFRHRFCDHRDFCEELISSCTDPRRGGETRDINEPEQKTWLRVGETMLWTALKRQKNTVVRVLVNHGADVNMKDVTGVTPLHYLCRDDQAEIDIDTIQHLITKGSLDVNQSDTDGRTPLHYLCEHETIKFEAIQCLINKGRHNVNQGDRNESTPLHYVCSGDKVNLEIVKLLITEGNGDINQGDRNGSTPLHYVCSRDKLNLEIVKLLITEGKGDINQCEQNRSTPLHYLCDNKSVDSQFMYFLLNEGKGDFHQGDEHGSTPLHFLCRNETLHVKSVLHIINEGKGDVNKSDSYGVTPLHYLCRGLVELSGLLVLIKERKADVNKTDQYGNTPLHYLCRREGVDVNTVKLEITKLPGADVKKVNKLGHSPLDYLYKRETLPWTEATVDRSAVDLVVCRTKVGKKRINVLGPAMKLDSHRVHRNLNVKDSGRVLTNMAKSGFRSENQFRTFFGTCSNRLPFSLYPSTITYWENTTWLRWKSELGGTLLETGVVEGDSYLDHRGILSSLPQTYCVSVRKCHRHSGHLCIRVYRGRKKVRECVTLSRSPTPGAEFHLTVGVVVDVGRGRVGLIDLERGKLLHKFDDKFSEPVSPMFSVSPSDCDCEIEMRLVSGREISVTERKLKLIQKALFD